MNEPAIICPSCKTEIRSIDSPEAPLIDATSKQYEQQLAEFTGRESDIRRQQTDLMPLWAVL
jgi:hypothetical protein